MYKINVRDEIFYAHSVLLVKGFMYTTWTRLITSGYFSICDHFVRDTQLMSMYYQFGSFKDFSVSFEKRQDFVHLVHF